MTTRRTKILLVDDGLLHARYYAIDVRKGDGRQGI
jgi:hypothetical protein